MQPRQSTVAWLSATSSRKTLDKFENPPSPSQARASVRSRMMMVVCHSALTSSVFEFSRNITPPFSEHFLALTRRRPSGKRPIAQDQAKIVKGRNAAWKERLRPWCPGGSLLCGTLSQGRGMSYDGSDVLSELGKPTNLSSLELNIRPGRHSRASSVPCSS